MKLVICPTCGQKVMKYGKTKAGVQRRFCKLCNLSFTNAYNDSTKIFQSFLNWLFSKETQKDMPVPNTNNHIEGGVNAQLRDMLRAHRGLSLERRLKAVYWWCYMHSPRPLSISKILKVMPTDESIAFIYQRFNEMKKVDYSIPQWGDGLAWNELHRSTEFPTYWD